MVTAGWYTSGEQYREIQAGNDIKMGLGMPKHTLRMPREGKIVRQQLENSVKRLLTLILRLGWWGAVVAAEHQHIEQRRGISSLYG